MLTANYCPKTDMMPLLGGKFCGAKRMIGFMLFASGTLIDAMAFDKTALDGLITTDKVIGFVRPSNLEDNNEDPAYATSFMGERTQSSAGRKGWRFTFTRSSCFQNELNKLNQSENWDFAPVLEDGSVILRRTKSGDYAGFSAKIFVGMYNAPIMGGDDTGSTLEVDLVNSLNYWQNDAHTMSASDFDFNEVNPIAGISIETGVMVAAATTTTASITSLCSGVDIVGLTDPLNWQIEIDGVPTAISLVAYNANTKQYTFTHPALVAGTNVSIITLKNGSVVYVKDTNYYAGRSPIQTVV